MKYLTAAVMIVTLIALFSCASTEVCDQECKRERQERLNDMRSNRFNR